MPDPHETEHRKKLEHWKDWRGEVKVNRFIREGYGSLWEGSLWVGSEAARQLVLSWRAVAGPQPKKSE